MGDASKRRAEVVPAILAPDIEEYNHMIDRVSKFANRISIDLTDGEFAQSPTINLIQAHWPEKVKADFHLMYASPTDHTETLISLRPHLAVVHAEAGGDLEQMLRKLKQVGIKTGIALLQPTKPQDAEDLIKIADHCLIFAGSLGSYGGRFDPTQLDKVKEVRMLNPGIEISWDGGINHENIRQVADAGVDVINSGGYIAKSEDPQKAYDMLVKIANREEK